MGWGDGKGNQAAGLVEILLRLFSPGGFGGRGGGDKWVGKDPTVG